MLTPNATPNIQRLGRWQLFYIGIIYALICSACLLIDVPLPIICACASIFFANTFSDKLYQLSSRAFPSQPFIKREIGFYLSPLELIVSQCLLYCLSIPMGFSASTHALTLISHLFVARGNISYHISSWQKATSSYHQARKRLGYFYKVPSEEHSPTIREHQVKETLGSMTSRVGLRDLQSRIIHNNQCLARASFSTNTVTVYSGLFAALKEQSYIDATLAHEVGHQDKDTLHKIAYYHEKYLFPVYERLGEILSTYAIFVGLWSTGTPFYAARPFAFLSALKFFMSKMSQTEEERADRYACHLLDDPLDAIEAGKRFLQYELARMQTTRNIDQGGFVKRIKEHAKHALSTTSFEAILKRAYQFGFFIQECTGKATHPMPEHRAQAILDEAFSLGKISQESLTQSLELLPLYEQVCLPTPMTPSKNIEVCNSIPVPKDEPTTHSTSPHHTVIQPISRHSPSLKTRLHPIKERFSTKRILHNSLFVLDKSRAARYKKVRRSIDEELPTPITPRNSPRKAQKRNTIRNSQERPKKRQCR